jgi:hypothetical protein
MTPEELREEAKKAIARSVTIFKGAEYPVVQVKLRTMLKNDEIAPDVPAKYLGLSHTGYHVYSISAYKILEHL